MTSGTPSCPAACDLIIEAAPRRRLQRDPRLLLILPAAGLLALLIGAALRVAHEPDPLMRYGMWAFAVLLLLAALTAAATGLALARHANRRRVRLDTQRQTIEFDYLVVEDGRFVCWRRTPHLAFAVGQIQAKLGSKGLDIRTPRGGICVPDTMTNFVPLANWLTRTCVKCGYDLQGSPSGVCPECGAGAVDPAGEQPRWSWASAGRAVARIAAFAAVGLFAIGLAAASKSHSAPIRIAGRCGMVAGPPMVVGLLMLYEVVTDCVEGRRPRVGRMLKAVVFLGLALGLLCGMIWLG